jgi:arginyl-tRNA synthetase
MKSLKDILNHVVSEAFLAEGLDPRLGEVADSQRPDLCQFQANGALAAAKALKRNPRELGQRLASRLAGSPKFASVKMEGPGFINIIVAPGLLAQTLDETLADARLGVPEREGALSLVLDFGGPNVAKSMHVGHLRSSIIGDSLQRLSRFMGDRVVSDIHLGDWGTQMGMLIEAVRQRDPELPYFDPAFTGPYPAQSPVSMADLEQLYPAASAKCKQDEAAAERARQATMELQQGRPGYRALWQHFVNVSVSALKADLAELGVHFDLWLGESHYQQPIPAMLEDLKARGLAAESEGALVMPVEEAGDAKPMPPVLLVKGDGGFLYATTDLATLRDRVRGKADAIWYVVDKRQSLHFEQVFRAARKAGYASAGVDLEHLAFGTMNGPDGKPFKTRAGGVMRLRDLMEMVRAEALAKMEGMGLAAEVPPEERQAVARKVGLAALKFADLVNHRTADYVFDLEKFTRFEGKTGPYLLYAAVRIKSVLRKAQEQGLRAGAVREIGEREKDLALLLLKYPEALRASYAQRAPSHLCEHLFQLSQAFSSFYQQCHILHEQDPALRASWLALASLTLRQLEHGLGLLGIETPERM